MIRLVLPLFVFLLFVFEGTIFQIFAPERFGVTLSYIPRFTVVAIVFIAIFFGRTQGVFYGIIFGLLYDVVYTEMLGVYMFITGLIGYVFALSYKPFQRSFFLSVITTAVAVCVLEYFLYGLFLLLGLTSLTPESFAWNRLFPTVALNLLFATIIMLPIRKFSMYLQRFENNLDE